MRTPSENWRRLEKMHLLTCIENSRIAQFNWAINGGVVLRKNVVVGT
jgi:hypothetical protein